MSRPISIVLVACLVLAGCPAHRQVAPLTPLDQLRAWETLDAYCEAHGDDKVLCDKPGFKQARAQDIRLHGEARKLAGRLADEQARRGIDGAVAAGREAELLDEVDEAKRWQWIMFAIGIAGGALAVGIPVGVFK